MALEAWAVPQLAKLLPLDEESLSQSISYNKKLPKDAAASNLKTLLGESPEAIEFVDSFNSRRQVPALMAAAGTSRSVTTESTASRKQPRKNKKTALNNLPPARIPEDHGNLQGAYVKGQGDDYMVAKGRPKKEPVSAENTVLGPEHASTKPITSSSDPAATKPSKLPPSAAGALISDLKPSRSSSPATNSKTKISIQGGVAMHGQSTVLSDLDDAIRTLEIQMNPTLASAQDDVRRRCRCMATRHPLLSAAPNCLSCGKIICIKEGLGPCTFCKNRLLSASDLQAMVKVLIDERGKEKMEANNAAHKRAEVSKAPRPFSNISPPASSSATSSDDDSDKLLAARQHRDRLLNFQAENARRTRIHDEAADFETPDDGQSMWATPQDRALQLKRQQKLLRQQAWNAKPEYEKRRQVVSIDIRGGKALKTMAAIERHVEPESDVDDLPDETANIEKPMPFSKNPLLGSLIRPLYRADPKSSNEVQERRSTWRRVQDDNDDNEQWILDRGAHGGRNDAGILGDRIEEETCG